MKRIAFTCLTGLVMCAAAASVAAQDSVQTVKDLYAAAAYEDALAAANRLQGAGGRREVEQYRLFSLTALGRTDEAQKAMEALIESDPLYVLDPAETPPRVQDAFTRVKMRLLPSVAKQLYADGRAALDRKDRGEAIAKFEKLLKVIDTAGPTAAASLGELRVLGDGFLGLSRALPAAPAVATNGGANTAAAAAVTPTTSAVTPDGEERRPTRTSAATPSTKGNPAAAVNNPPAASNSAPANAGVASGPAPAGAASATNGSEPVVETRPIAISQSLPNWFPSDSMSRRSAFSGSVKVTIGHDGRVSAAEIVQSVHPTYDSMLVRAARGWLYQPAKRNGVAVESELVVEVNLRPR